MIFSKSPSPIPHSPPVGLTVEIPPADLTEPLSPILSSSESNSLPFTASTPLVEDHKRARDERLCKLFGLDNEQFKDYFLCAYMTKTTPWFVVQGLLYVFEQHICFLSSLFGIETRKVIPLQHVESVNKATNLGIPNSIKITYKDGTSDFFTSFLSRKPAYSLISEALQAVMFGPKSCEPRKMEVSMFGRKVKRHNVFPRVGSTSSMHRVRSTDNVRPSSRPSSPCPDDENDVPSGGRPIRLTSHRRSRSGHRRNNSRGGGSRGQNKDWEDDLSAQIIGDQQQLQQLATQPEGELLSLQTGSQTSSGEEVVMETPFMAPSAQLRCLEKPLPGDTPAVPEGWTLLAEGTVNGTTPEQLAVVLLSDDQDTSLIVKFNNLRGHRKVLLDPHGWQDGSPELEGSVRLFEFESKKLGAWTRCVQQQRCRYYPNSTIIFNTEQKMPDLKIALMGKIGDQFSVDCHWEIVRGPGGEAAGGSRSSNGSLGSVSAPAAAVARTPTPPAAVSTPLPSTRTASRNDISNKSAVVRVFGQVNFASHASMSLPKGKIRSSAISELKEWYNTMIPFMEEQLKEFNAKPPTPVPSPNPSVPQPDPSQQDGSGAKLKPPRPTTPSRRIPDPQSGPNKPNLPPLYPTNSLTSPASPSTLQPAGSLGHRKQSGLAAGSGDRVFASARAMQAGMGEVQRQGVVGKLEGALGRGLGWMVLALLVLNVLLLSRVSRMEAQLQQLAARLAGQ